MKTFNFLIRSKYFNFILLIWLIFPLTSYGGGGTTTRNKCRTVSKKYHAHAHVNAFQIYQQYKSNSKCDQFSVVANGNVPCSYAAAGNGPSGSWISTYTTWWYCGAGNEYIIPKETPDDSSGFSRSEFDQKIIFNGEGKNGVIKIQNIEGILSASINTRFSSFYRIVLWMPQDNEKFMDTTITSKKVLWEASVRIEENKLVTTGGFRNDDFELIYTKDSIYDSVTGLNKTFFIRKVRPKNVIGQSKLSKTLNLQDLVNEAIINNERGIPIEILYNVSMDNIAVSVIASSGYGTFVDDLINSTKSMNLIQTNSDFSAISNNQPYFNIYPNPISNETQIEYFVENNNTVKIELIDITGKKISNIDVINDGNEVINSIKFVRPSNTPSGIYFIRLIHNEGILTRKVIFLN